MGTTETSFLATDALGSVTDAVSTSGGTVVAARQYDAWGNPRNGSAPAAGSFKLGYTGHQYDVETGLTYARARYYDSELGRFLSRDSYEGTLADAPSLHRYRYARANPLRWVDPSGYREATPTELQEMSRWGETLAAAEKRFYGYSTAIQFLSWLPPKRGAALVIDVLRQNLQSRRAAIARAADGMSVDPGTYEVGESTFSAPDGTQFTVKTFPMWLTGAEAYVSRKAAVGQALTSPFGTAAYGVSTTLGASEEKVDAAIIAAAQGGEFIGPRGASTLKSKVFARPPKNTQKPSAARQASGSYVVVRKGVANVQQTNPFDRSDIKASELPKRPLKSSSYSVLFEARLQKGTDFPGVPDSRHFAESNRQMHEAFQADSVLAAQMDTLYPGLVDAVKPGARGGVLGEAPTPEVTWHHVATKSLEKRFDYNGPGVMQLVPRSHHKAPGPVQKSLHPDGIGGMEEWGGGR